MATEKPVSERTIGAEIKRLEDPRFITGRATYINDIQEPNMVYASILRSQHAHAHIHDIDTSAAEAHDSVLAVFTAADIEAADIPGDIPCIYRVPEMNEPDHPVLARDKVRYQGKPVAVVIAEDQYTASNARNLIDVDYEQLEAVVDPFEAMKEESPTVHEDVPDNVCFEWEIGDETATDEAFDQAEQTFEFEFTNPRLIATPIEPRGAIAEYDAVSEELVVQMTSQNPFTHQEIMAHVLDHPKRKIRIKVPDIGGGFGSKSMYYPGETLTAFCAMELDRPVKWIETRSEAMLADEQGRGQWIAVAVAVNDGTVSGLRVQTTASLGGDLSSKGVVGPTTIFGPLLSGQYEIPAIHFESRGVLTNQTPTAPYRGVGRAEAAFTVERAMTLTARELGEDPTEFRLKNFIPPEKFPYETPVASIYDSGDYETTFNKALTLIDYETLRDRQAELREEGRYLGIGVSAFIEPAGFAPSSVSELLGMGQSDATVQSSFWESSTIRVHETGEVTVYCGTASHGQGSETTFSQIVAEKLDVDPNDVQVVEGKDTEEASFGTGTLGSRNAAVGGGAIAKSADKVIDKGREIAAYQLEADKGDIVFEDGKFGVQGAPERSMTLAEVAVESYLGNNLPEDLEPGLEANSYYDPENFTFGFGTHVAVVEVNPENGQIDIQRYLAIDDCGKQINPMIVEGQIHGGVAQGIGQALYEGAVYDENGNLLSSPLQNYAVPKPIHIPDFEVDKTITPSPHHPLGVKGVGEGGMIGSPPAVVNAVTYALVPFNVQDIEMPITPAKVWRAIQEYKEDQ